MLSLMIDGTYLIPDAKLQINSDGTGNLVMDGIPLNLKYKIEGESLFINVGVMSSFKENCFNIKDNVLTINDGVGYTIFIKN